jgi:hypothetical protein
LTGSAQQSGKTNRTMTRSRKAHTDRSIGERSRREVYRPTDDKKLAQQVSSKPLRSIHPCKRPDTTIPQWHEEATAGFHGKPVGATELELRQEVVFRAGARGAHGQAMACPRGSPLSMPFSVSFHPFFRSIVFLSCHWPDNMVRRVVCGQRGEGTGR